MPSRDDFLQLMEDATSFCDSYRILQDIEKETLCQP